MNKEKVLQYLNDLRSNVKDVINKTKKTVLQQSNYSGNKIEIDNIASDKSYSAYSHLSNIVREHPEKEHPEKEHPESAKQVLATDNVKKHETPLNDAYESLPDIGQSQPELVEQVLANIKMDLQSDNNDSDSLSSAYSHLSDIVKKHPESAKQVLAIFNTAVRSYKNDSDSLSSAYSHLSDIVREHPESAKQVFAIFNTAVQKGSSLWTMYRRLSDIVNAQPQLSEPVFTTFNTAVQSNSNDYRTLNTAYDCLTEIAKSHPELADQVFATFGIAVQSYENRNLSLSSAYSHLSDIAEEHPESAEQVFATFSTALQSDKNNSLSLMEAYKYLADIVKERPELSEQVFATFGIALQLDKNSIASFKKAYEYLADIVKVRPELADQVFATYNTTFRLDDIDSSNTINVAYSNLASTFEAHPELAEQILATFSTAVQSKQDGNSLKIAYDCLSDIVKIRPELADQVFATYNTALESNHNNHNSSEEAYDCLSKVIVAQPALSEQVFATFNTALQSNQNNSDSLKKAYRSLSYIAQARPALAEQVLETVKTAVQSDKNDSLSLNVAYDLLPDIVDAQPALAEQVLEIVKNVNQSCRWRVSLLNKYNLLSKIAQSHPELAEQVLETTINSGHDRTTNKINVYKTCMRHLPLEETISKYPEKEQDLRVAHKGRFSTNEEFKYALYHFDKETLAESMIFRAQQRVMNVLFSTSAQENGISKEDASSFRRADAPESVKDYMESNLAWLIPASFKGAAVFKEYFPSYIKLIQNHNQKNPEDKLSIHDAVYWLPEPMSPEANARFSQFIQRNILYQNAEHRTVHRPLKELSIIAKNWKALEKKLQDREDNSAIAKLKYNDVLSICMSVIYEDQRNNVFAIEAAKHGTPGEQYHNYEDIYLAGLKVPEPFDSKKEFKEGKYTGRFLPREDPRTGFFGDYTDCCQHFGGVGHSCAVSTVKHPFSQLFVIENDKGEIVAGSWTWENTEGDYREVCFDNIEALGELKSRPEINKIYEQVGQYLTQEENCHKVTIGIGYQDADVSGYKQTEAISLPKLYGHDGTDNYSDAHSQVLLSENPNAQPLDKTQESQRYIRDVCFLDIDAMDNISYKVFPESDKQLQAPDNMSGFVIEDREKGVVGYCLYNKEEKSIYDMAVLPEYRKDKNASSRKLFAEMIRVIHKDGGEWSAEMRDNTTLKYLKIMAERGLVQYEENGVDHTMCDGSKVISVTFRATSPEEQEQNSHTSKKLNSRHDDYNR